MDRILKSVAVENWGAGPYLVETWGVNPGEPNAGSKWWPEETITTRLPRKGDDYDWNVAIDRLAELAPELSWVAIA